MCVCQRAETEIKNRGVWQIEWKNTIGHYKTVKVTLL